MPRDLVSRVLAGLSAADKSQLMVLLEQVRANLIALVPHASDDVDSSVEFVRTPVE